jgi:hypothetical protein
VFVIVSVFECVLAYETEEYILDFGQTLYWGRFFLYEKKNVVTEEEEEASHDLCSRTIVDVDVESPLDLRNTFTCASQVLGQRIIRSLESELFSKIQQHAIYSIVPCSMTREHALFLISLIQRDCPEACLLIHGKGSVVDSLALVQDPKTSFLVLELSEICPRNMLYLIRGKGIAGLIQVAKGQFGLSQIGTTSSCVLTYLTKWNITFTHPILAFDFIDIQPLE